MPRVDCRPTAADKPSTTLAVEYRTGFGHKQAFERRTLQTFGRQQPSQSGLAISIATRMQETHASKQQFARVSEANALT